MIAFALFYMKWGGGRNFIERVEQIFLANIVHFPKARRSYYYVTSYTTSAGSYCGLISRSKARRATQRTHARARAQTHSPLHYILLFFFFGGVSRSAHTVI